MRQQVRRYLITLSAFVWFGLQAQTARYGSLTYEVVKFEVHIVDCDQGARGNLVVPDEIEGLPVTTIRTSAFSNCSQLAGVELPESITNIGNSVFEWCKQLQQATIPAKATTLGTTIFRECINLVAVDWESGSKTIPAFTFMGCESLSSFAIPEHVTIIGRGAFQESGLESIIIPDGVITIEFQSFWLCKSLKSVRIPASATDIQANAFTGSDYLTQVRIPERYHNESEALRIGIEVAWPNGFLLEDAELTGPEESLEIRLAPVITVKGVPGEVKTIDVAESPDGPWKLWRIVIVATGGASEVDLEEGAENRFYRIRP